MIGHLRAVGVALLIVLITLVILPVHQLARWRRWPLRKRTARAWHRAIAWALSLRIDIHGRPPRHGDPGLLLAANHVSWLDIVVLGAVADVSFIAKDEIDTWPFFGWLARWQESVFIARDARATTGKQAAEIGRRLADSDHLVLFAEGTTSDGNFVAPFKSALFGAVGPRAGRVQPVGIAYVGLAGIVMGRRDRSMAAWPGTVELRPHLWQVLREGRFDVAVAFGEPIDGIADRKQLARSSEHAVRQMASALLRGRDPSSAAGENTVKARP